MSNYPRATWPTWSRSRPLLDDSDVGRLREVLGRHLSSTLVDENGWTDLHWAAALNQQDLAGALIDLGADVRAALHDDGEPLSDRLTRSMNKLGIKPDWLRYGYEPSHIAAFLDAKEMLTVLFEAGADVNAKTNGGDTPLHEAAYGNAGDAVTVLIEHGADNRANDNGGSTPIHYAALTNAGNAAAVLIQHGADVNAKDHEGQTPLEVATLEGAQAVVEMLRKQLGDL